MTECIANAKNKIIDFFKINDSYKIAKYTFLFAIVISICTYGITCFVNAVNPDTTIEGFYYFSRADWTSRGCGRWFIRYYNMFHLNVVSPVLSLVEYTIFNWLTSLIVIKLLNIRKNTYSLLTTLILFVTPTIISQMTYTHVVGVYSFSCLLASLFVYFSFKKGIKNSILAIICLTVSIGAYQSYLGFAAVLTVMLLIKQLISNIEIEDVFKQLLRSAILASVSMILYYVLFKLDLIIYGLEPIERVSNFNLVDIFSKFNISFIDTYKAYFHYFSDGILKRDYLYILDGIVFVLTLLIVLFKIIKEKEYIRLLVVLVFIALIPVASNIIDLIAPDNGISLLMAQQNWLIFPFILSLLEIINVKFFNYVKICFSLVLVLLSWTYIISANATYRCYDLSHKYIYNQMSNVVDRIYEFDEYELNRTPIIIVGCPDEQELRDNNMIYRYAIGLNKNVAFWDGETTTLYGRKSYFMNMFGIDAKDIELEDYNNITYSEEFKEMESWPSKHSIRIINNCVVVKFSNYQDYIY